MFGKLGRPPEDHLLRQREIYLAVSPLILAKGVGALSMRDAAHVACLSIGGLYHYFPTKRDLVLHGLSVEARDRLCREYRDRLAADAPLGISRYLDAYLDHSVRMLRFIQPAVRAALELGEATLQAQLDSGMTANVGELVESLQTLAPDLPPRQLAVMGRMIRRMALGVLLDRGADFDEVRDQLHALIDGYLARYQSFTTIA